MVRRNDGTITNVTDGINPRRRNRQPDDKRERERERPTGIAFPPKSLAVSFLAELLLEELNDPGRDARTSIKWAREVRVAITKHLREEKQHSHLGEREREKKSNPSPGGKSVVRTKTRTQADKGGRRDILSFFLPLQD